MSHTDKTRPWWVRIRDNSYPRIERHMHAGHMAYGRDRDEVRCDLDEFDSRTHNNRYAGWCGYDFPHERRFAYDSCPKWYRDHTWTEPERVRERDDLRMMMREYNGEGEIDDDDFPNFQHRHRSSWWYW